MDERGPQLRERAKCLRELCVHLGGRHGAALTGDADGAEIRKLTQCFDRRWFDEENGLDAARGEGFERVGRAGEIVREVGEKQVDGY
jgi:hypothetical protein